jgi:hypothetical protein
VDGQESRVVRIVKNDSCGWFVLFVRHAGKEELWYSAIEPVPCPHACTRTTVV